jgi:LacI family gluconate utilization system Gnt-I transcriptional repressor
MSASTSPARTRATGRVTLADVAQAAGVSPITVSRALRGERAVDPELVARVQAAATKLGYVPDPAARALASSHSSHVAVLIPMLSNALFVDLLEQVQRTLRPAGYQALIGITHYDAVEEEALLREQLLHRPAGLMVTGTERSEPTRALIAQSGVPCVHLMEISRTPGVYSVGLSQADAGAAMTRHLLSRGRRRIAFGAAQLDPRTMQRLDGWRLAMKEAGLYDPTLAWHRPSTPSSSATTTSRRARCSPRCAWVWKCPRASPWPASTISPAATRCTRPSPPCTRRAPRSARPRPRCCWR